MSRSFFKLPKSKAEKVLGEALKIATTITVDQLDCIKSFCRTPTIKTTDEILKMGVESPNTHYVFIINGYNNSINESMTDIGLSVSAKDNITYFLWINVDRELAYGLVKKYKLKSM